MYHMIYDIPFIILSIDISNTKTLFGAFSSSIRVKFEPLQFQDISKLFSWDVYYMPHKKIQKTCAQVRTYYIEENHKQPTIN